MILFINIELFVPEDSEEVNVDEDPHFFHHFFNARCFLGPSQDVLLPLFHLAIMSHRIHLSISLVHSLSQLFEGGAKSFQHFLNFPHLNSLSIALHTSSIFQNLSCRKMVPHLYWRRIRTSSSGYTATQLFSPRPMSSGLM